MSGYYILDGHTPVAEPDALTWGRWMKSADRHVAKTEIGPLWISTVFLGIDHNFHDRGAPILFETMIFGFDEDDSYQTRCCTWEDAERMHQLALGIAERLVRASATTLADFIAGLNIANTDTDSIS